MQFFKIFFFENIECFFSITTLQHSMYYERDSTILNESSYDWTQITYTIIIIIITTCGAYKKYVLTINRSKVYIMLRNGCYI